MTTGDAEDAGESRVMQWLRESNHSKWALLFPVFLVIGIRFGIFTPFEVDAFAVFYAIACCSCPIC